MPTFEQAQQLVTDDLGDDYQVEAWGWENDNEYQLEVTNLTGKIPEDGPRITVNKTTGDITHHYGYYWIDNRTPCGEPEPDDEE